MIRINRRLKVFLPRLAEKREAMLRRRTADLIMANRLGAGDV